MRYIMNISDTTRMSQTWLDSRKVEEFAFFGSIFGALEISKNYNWQELLPQNP